MPDRSSISSRRVPVVEAPSCRLPGSVSRSHSIRVRIPKIVRSASRCSRHRSGISLSAVTYRARRSASRSIRSAKSKTWSSTTISSSSSDIFLISDSIPFALVVSSISSFCSLGKSSTHPIGASGISASGLMRSLSPRSTTSLGSTPNSRRSASNLDWIRPRSAIAPSYCVAVRSRVSTSLAYSEAIISIRSRSFFRSASFAFNSDNLPPRARNL